MSRSRLSRAWRGPGRAAARWLLQWWVESFVGLGACYAAMPPRPYDDPLPGDDPRLDADVVGWAARQVRQSRATPSPPAEPGTG
jgi:hypothetical protein